MAWADATESPGGATLEGEPRRVPERRGGPPGSADSVEATAGRRAAFHSLLTRGTAPPAGRVWAHGSHAAPSLPALPRVNAPLREGPPPVAPGLPLGAQWCRPPPLRGQAPTIRRGPRALAGPWPLPPELPAGPGACESHPPRSGEAQALGNPGPPRLSRNRQLCLSWDTFLRQSPGDSLQVLRSKRQTAPANSRHRSARAPRTASSAQPVSPGSTCTSQTPPPAAYKPARAQGPQLGLRAQGRQPRRRARGQGVLLWVACPSPAPSSVHPGRGARRRA